MKAPCALVIASLLLAPLAHADSKPMPSDHPAMGCGMLQGDGPTNCPGMQGDLKLTADQQQKIQAIHEEAHQKMLKVLTPEQAAKMEEHRKTMLEHRSERMKKRADRMEKHADMMKEPAKAQ